MKIEVVKKSVHQVLREEIKTDVHQQRYDLIYCAGVFDYLSDRSVNGFMIFFTPCWNPVAYSSLPTLMLRTRRVTAWKSTGLAFDSSRLHAIERFDSQTELLWKMSSQIR